VPAYAATIHKSQGSEYPAVVIPVMTQHYTMLQRNLLYTGVTRAVSGSSFWWARRRPSPSRFEAFHRRCRHQITQLVCYLGSDQIAFNNMILEIIQSKVLTYLASFPLRYL